MNTFTFITNNFSLLLTKSNCFNNNVLFGFEINNLEPSDDLSLLELNKSQLLSQNNVNFAIYIHCNDRSANFKTLIQSINHKNSLFQYIFHPKYAIVHEKPVFCFNETERENVELKELIETLEENLISQGYKGITPIYFSNKTTTISENIYFCFPAGQNNNEIETTYFNLLNDQFYTSNYLGIRTNKIEETIQQLSQVEGNFFKSNPIQFQFLEKYDQLMRSNKKLSEELGYTKLDLENQKTYLDFFKDKDEALKINEFYHNEYEILPLWYKKMGHIIKVLMGKRTFNSLFDNNVNKYKN